MRLRTNEVYPIHQSLSCCGRELLPKPKLVRLGVQRVEDPHHPRGYRELRSPAEMRKLLNRKIRQQGGMCAICHEEFTDYNDIVPDHNVVLSISLPRYGIMLPRAVLQIIGFWGMSARCGLTGKA
jgi:hypothetical protein